MESSVSTFLKNVLIFCEKLLKQVRDGIEVMNTCTRLSNQAKLIQTGSLPTRQQLEAFLQSKGVTAKKLEQMSSWEQIQLTREYQKLKGKSA